MFDPKNEQGVVAVFMMDAKDAGWDIVEIGIAFPDAVLSKDGIQWRVEFEYRASNFIQHKHDARECDLIICWNNDYPDSPIPILSINSSSWKTESFQKADPKDVEILYWREQCRRLEVEVERLKSRIETVVTPEEREIMEASRDEAILRRRELLRYCIRNPSFSYQRAADDLAVTNKTTVYNDLKWLERYGYAKVERRARSTDVLPIGKYERFLIGE